MKLSEYIQGIFGHRWWIACERRQERGWYIPWATWEVAGLSAEKWSLGYINRKKVSEASGWRVLHVVSSYICLFHANITRLSCFPDVGVPWPFCSPHSPWHCYTYFTGWNMWQPFKYWEDYYFGEGLKWLCSALERGRRAMGRQILAKHK